MLFIRNSNRPKSRTSSSSWAMTSVGSTRVATTTGSWVTSPKHRPDCRRGRLVQLLVRAAELYRRSGSIHYRPITNSHWTDQGRIARSRHRFAGQKIQALQNYLTRSVTRPGSLAKIIWGTRTNFSPPIMGSMNSSAISITSMPRRSRRIQTTPKTRNF
jgi:hypothetical protein